MHNHYFEYIYNNKNNKLSCRPTLGATNDDAMLTAQTGSRPDNKRSLNIQHKNRYKQ